MIAGVAFVLAARLFAADSADVCYALRLEPWSVPRYASLRVPDTVRLSRGATADSGPLRPDLDRGTAFGHRDPPFYHTYNSWRAGAETLTLWWSDGVTGVVLRGRVQGDSLHGRVDTVTDGGTSPQARAAVAGSRTPCPRARAR